MCTVILGWHGIWWVLGQIGLNQYCNVPRATFTCHSMWACFWGYKSRKMSFSFYFGSGRQISMFLFQNMLLILEFASGILLWLPDNLDNINKLTQLGDETINHSPTDCSEMHLKSVNIDIDIDIYDIDIDISNDENAKKEEEWIRRVQSKPMSPFTHPSPKLCFHHPHGQRVCRGFLLTTQFIHICQ